MNVWAYMQRASWKAPDFLLNTNDSFGVRLDEDTHWLGFPGGGGGLQNAPGIFPGICVAALTVSGQVLSAGGQSLTIGNTHLIPLTHQSPNSVKCKSVRLCRPLLLAEFPLKPLLTLAH